MPLPPSLAYARYVRVVRSLAGRTLRPHEVEVLLEAADARLFGEEELAGRMADTDVVLALLEESGRLDAPGAQRLSALLLAVNGALRTAA